MTTSEEGWPLDRIQAHVAENLPMISAFGFEMTRATPECCDVLIHEQKLVFRPGGIVAGPVLFTAADVGAYGLILSKNGAVMATTVDLIIHFLRPGAGLPLLARTVPVKFGKRLVTTDTVIAPKEDPERLIARATSTYVLP